MEEANHSIRVKAPDLLSSRTSVQKSLMHDAYASNLPRRAVVDKGSTGGQSKFLRCKDKVLVSTFNARTLNQPHPLEELSDSAAKQDIDVICIQEHRFIHDLKNDVNKVPNGYTLITSTATKNSAGAAVGGLGFLLNQKATQCLSSIDTVSHGNRDDIH